MFAAVYIMLLWIFPILQYSGICVGEVLVPYLSLYSPGIPEYTDVIVRRAGENLTLVCELKGDVSPRIFVWNYVPSDNLTAGESSYKARGTAVGANYTLTNVQPSDSGHYVCAAPEWRYSTSKFILVQNRSNDCARGALWCAALDTNRGHCVPAVYVCDGYRDCVRGEDEAPHLCPARGCSRPDKLNCSSGRCISESACCRPGTSPDTCRQPDCCREHPRYQSLEGWGEPDYPVLFEDRHAPDEYGFIQSTIYTVTACALIFMIAVVLLVSAICKMHMKRAALRSYTARPLHRHQLPRFPPCYEASRLLEERGLPPSSLAHSPAGSPVRQYSAGYVLSGGAGGGLETAQGRGFGLSRVAALFNARYRQVCTENPDVELRSVPPTSPRRAPATFLAYRSPTECDLNADLFFNTEVSECGRDLNYMATPLELLRERPRPLTLQLGRFQLSIPRLSRRRSVERRPDTPNVTELNIEDIDFVRLNSNETYTLNGRTIRLLGADFENYPTLSDSPARPPPYNDTMRYKVLGPPPEYLSRDCLTEADNGQREHQARANVEMPPGYEELGGNAGNITGNEGNAVGNAGDTNGEARNTNSDEGYNNSDAGNVINNAGNIAAGNAVGNAGNTFNNASNIVNDVDNNTLSNAGSINNDAGYNNSVAGNENSDAGNEVSNATNNNTDAGYTNGDAGNNMGNENKNTSDSHVVRITSNIEENIGNVNGGTGNKFVNTDNLKVIANTGDNNSVITTNKNGNTDLSNVSENNGNDVITVTTVTENVNKENNNNGCNGNTVSNDFNSIINDLPPIDSDVNCNETERCFGNNEYNEVSVNNNIEC